MVKGNAEAFTKGMKALNRWKDGEVDLDSASSWGPDTLFVCDSLTGMGDAAINWSRAQNQAKLEDSDWQYTADAMNRQDKLTQMLMSLDCHVIITAHIRYLGGGGNQEIKTKDGAKQLKEVDSRTEGIGYPSALGRKLPTEIGRHFNTILEFEVNQLGKRQIRTKQAHNVRVKSAVVNIPDTLTIETGMYEFFKAAKGTSK